MVGDSAWAGVFLGYALSAALGAVSLFNDGRLDPLWHEGLVFVGLVAIPAILATIGCLGHPRLLLAAGLVSFPLSAFFMISAAGLPLLIPAFLYLWGYRTHAAPPRAPVSVVVLTMVALLAGGWASLSMHRDPMCWERKVLATGRELYDEWRPARSVSTWRRSRNFSGSSPTVLNVEGGCDRDRVVWWEIAVGAALLAGAVVLPPSLAKPRANLKPR